MFTLKFYCLTIFICGLYCLQNVQSDLQISPENIEYAVARISSRERAVHLKSPPYFGHASKFNLQTLIERKSKVEQQQPQHDVEDMPQTAADNQEILSGNKNNKKLNIKNFNKKMEANAQSSTLSQQHEIKSNEEELEEQEPTEQQLEEVEAKPIIQNGVNQPHNHQNQQHLTVNQVEVRQQLLPPPHHFKLLNVVNHRNKRQTHAENSHNNNNNGNQQQQQQQQKYSTITIQYYPQQQEQTVVEYQLQEQQPQQYQLQYYQTSQSSNQQQFQQNHNNIELIVNGNSLSTFPQSTTKVTAAMTMPIPLPIVTTSTPKPLPQFTTLINSSPLSPSLSTSSMDNSIKPLLPLEVIKDVNADNTTLPPRTVCRVCCITNEFSCSSCCDGTPLLNAQTLKTLGG
ncbi:putative cyclin-dependent serine/threonine-protein kinase DDB_G0272797/DDB_G0274007 [Lucilia cuprina]|uniref:putative cyclin-dependent serine/threonine-protein kinase DDB_G0272797/DDB_G0274007 n=1 Tax=Lucilia cuprina TaxID=7375 RepID=UPI001F05EC67|nr:putative cyclin-dependent serine/threonine-protein kinase DDB_G0272797/DDB_G0274007 [Lucilia cuprina]